MLPAEYRHPVIYVFTDHRKELSAYRIFLHLFVVALFGYILQSRLKAQVFLSGNSIVSNAKRALFGKKKAKETK